MKSDLFLKILVAAIFVLALVGIVMIANGGEVTSPEMATATNYVVNLSLVLLIAATALAVVMSLFSLLKNPAALKKTLLGLAIFAALFAISYFASNDAAVFGTNKESLLEAGSTSKWSGTGLIFSYVLLAVAGIFFVVDLLKGLVKS